MKVTRWTYLTLLGLDETNESSSTAAQVRTKLSLLGVSSVSLTRIKNILQELAEDGMMVEEKDDLFTSVYWLSPWGQVVVRLLRRELSWLELSLEEAFSVSSYQAVVVGALLSTDQWSSAMELSERTLMSVDSVRRGLASLEKEGRVLTTIGKSKKGSNCTLYRLATIGLTSEYEDSSDLLDEPVNEDSSDLLGVLDEPVSTETTPPEEGSSSTETDPPTEELEETTTPPPDEDSQVYVRVPFEIWDMVSTQASLRNQSVPDYLKFLVQEQQEKIQSNVFLLEVFSSHLEKAEVQASLAGETLKQYLYKLLQTTLHERQVQLMSRMRDLPWVPSDS